MQDNSGGWSENPLHGKEKPFHCIQPREEHSTGGSCVTLKVYKQEKWSREQIQRVQHKVQTRPDHFWKIIIWDAWINLYQNDMKKKVWRTFETAHDLKHTVSSVKHGGVVWWDEHPWLPVALDYCCLVMMWQRTETARRILKWCTLCPDSDKLSKADWAVLHSKNGPWPKHTAKATQELEVKAVNYSAMAKSISWSQPDWACISLAEDKLKKERPTNKQQLKSAASKGLAKHHKGGNPVFGDVHELQT